MSWGSIGALKMPSEHRLLLPSCSAFWLMGAVHRMLHTLQEEGGRGGSSSRLPLKSQQPACSHLVTLNRRVGTPPRLEWGRQRKGLRWRLSRPSYSACRSLPLRFNICEWTRNWRASNSIFQSYWNSSNKISLFVKQKPGRKEIEWTILYCTRDICKDYCAMCLYILHKSVDRSLSSRTAIWCVPQCGSIYSY